MNLGIKRAYGWRFDSPELTNVTVQFESEKVYSSKSKTWVNLPGRIMELKNWETETWESEEYKTEYIAKHGQWEIDRNAGCDNHNGDCRNWDCVFSFGAENLLR